MDPDTKGANEHINWIKVFDMDQHKWESPQASTFRTKRAEPAETKAKEQKGNNQKNKEIKSINAINNK